ncbi:MAG TPA: four helix bundle protein [Terracidiphilus sp.]
MPRITTAPAQSYRELLVWQRAIQLPVALYRLTERFPARKTYGPSSQIRRSAVSVPSNIAEGQGRLARGEFRQFPGIARGSNFEIQTPLEIARTLPIGEQKMLVTSRICPTKWVSVSTCCSDL